MNMPSFSSSRFTVTTSSAPLDVVLRGAAGLRTGPGVLPSSPKPSPAPPTPPQSSALPLPKADVPPQLVLSLGAGGGCPLPLGTSSVGSAAPVVKVLVV